MTYKEIMKMKKELKEFFKKHKGFTIPVKSKEWERVMLKTFKKNTVLFYEVSHKEYVDTIFRLNLYTCEFEKGKYIPMFYIQPNMFRRLYEVQNCDCDNILNNKKLNEYWIKLLKKEGKAK